MSKNLPEVHYRLALCALETELLVHHPRVLEQVIAAFEQRATDESLSDGWRAAYREIAESPYAATIQPGGKSHV